MSSGHLLLGCHFVQHLVHPLPFTLAIISGPFLFCFSVYSIVLIIFVLLLISDLLIYLIALNLTFSSPLLFEQFFLCQLFIERPCLSAIGHCWLDTLVHYLFFRVILVVLDLEVFPCFFFQTALCCSGPCIDFFFCSIFEMCSLLLLCRTLDGDACCPHKGSCPPQLLQVAIELVPQ